MLNGFWTSQIWRSRLNYRLMNDSSHNMFHTIKMVYLAIWLYLKMLIQHVIHQLLHSSTSSSSLLQGTADVKCLKLIHLLHLILLRSKTHLLQNGLLKLLLQETFTQAHQFPIHIHMIYTSKGIHLNRCPLSVFWTHLPYDASKKSIQLFRL